MTAIPCRPTVVSRIRPGGPVFSGTIPQVKMWIHGHNHMPGWYLGSHSSG